MSSSRSDPGQDPGSHLRELIDTPVRTAVALLMLPPALVYHSAGAFVSALRNLSPRRTHRHYVGFARFCMRFGGTRLEVRGTEHIQPGRAYVVVPNHESTWDPPSIVAGLPDLVMRFVVKRSLMQIPIFGHALHRTGNVTVFRTQTTGDAQRIREVMDHRDPDVSILFFAEGMRSRDGSFHPFKMGAFVSALGYRLPILPIATAGTYAIWPKGTLRLRRGTVVIEVGKPIPTDGMTLDDRNTLREQIHKAVARLRTRARQHLRILGENPEGID